MSLREYLYYEEPGIALYCGDALAVLREIDPSSVDVVLTDPPYSSGGLFRGDRAEGVHTKYVLTQSWAGHQLPGFTGDTRDQHGYRYWVALWLAETRRLLVPGGIAAVFTDWRQLPVTTDSLQAAGFIWRGIVCWHKPSARPNQARWANACEYVAWGTSGPRELQGRAFPGWYAVNAPQDREHITQKPQKLIQALLEILPEGGVVLDPFAGTGTTLVAAKALRRRAIGIEIEPRYCEIAVTRLRQGMLTTAPSVVFDTAPPRALWDSAPTQEPLRLESA